jgi:hypothetical protein
MRYPLGTVVSLLLALSVLAAETRKPNTLTAGEIGEGWILLFDGRTTFGWKTEGEAKVEDGALQLGGGPATRAVPTMQFGDCELRLEYQGTAQLNFKGGRNSSTIRLASPATWHAADIQTEFDPRRNGLETSQQQPFLQAKAKYNTDPLLFEFEIPPGGRISVRNIRLKPHGLKPIFNGKDLTGWREFPGRKSKFTVTPEGWILVKNGPGDLQTEGQWDDFVLQIDCLSNGERLNSGVFFRCRPNEYQNGYEAQVHNGYVAPPGKEYTIEEYDPTTHQLTGTKKVRYTAMDYGTGAIYRRMPARFQAARDHEWFTMTIIARGNHIATWVNGLQMVDWTDNRPHSDNARTGCKLGKGPISLQGHDPTTDLSFRNIRIAELVKESSIAQSRGGK